MLIPAAPRGAVRRMERTAMVSTWRRQTTAEAARSTTSLTILPSRSDSSPAFLSLASSSAIEPTAAYT